MKKLLPIVLFFASLAFLFSADTSFAQVVNTINPPDGAWVPDSEVTFVGKTGARAGNLLDWAVGKYQWTTDASNLRAFWATISVIVFALCIFLVMVAAFIMIITRGRSITLKRFVPRFIGVLVLIAFTFSLIQILYTITDIVQQFFLKNQAGTIISQKDLLYIGFPYETFTGYRRFGSTYDESAFISLLLVKLTAVTYYAMVVLLILRKIILWFFLIISPVFPILLLFYPVRNTAKIWIGEFFRWLLYAPLFAIFLSGVVTLWAKSNPATAGIPLSFDLSQAGTAIVYPTAINILLGGPGQQLSITNSVNLPDTFALYVVALLMLWVVILLPWILLQIFLDYFHAFSFGENTLVQQIINRGGSFMRPPPPSGSTPKPPPVSYQPAGMAKSIPIAATRPLQMAKPMEIAKLTNLSIPTMRDVARFETATLSSKTETHMQVTAVKETLSQIANPALARDPVKQSQYARVRQTLVQEKEKGNPVASSMLSAANETLRKQDQTPANLPVVNKVQSVSVDDYEAVKKMWQENYEKLEPPAGKTQESWIQEDIAEITKATNLLSAADTQQVREGMKLVSKILPILLIGGFSQSEVVAYLKAKLEAARSVVGSIQKKQQEEEDLMPLQKKAEAEKSMAQSQEAALPTEEALPRSGIPEKSGTNEKKPPQQ